MADPIVGAVISGLVEVIFDKLGSTAFQEIGRVFGVKDELKRLDHTLSDIKAVLLDAEKQQMTQHAVRNWLQNLKEVAYDIEDVLDFISAHDLEKKVQLSSFSQKLREISLRYSLPGKLKAICKRLDEIAANRRNYNFQECHQISLGSVDTGKERETHSSIQEARVVGREHDRDWIVTRLVSFSTHQTQGISVLPIVGVGGMGKTTLAKLVYNDRRVKFFEVKVWAYIPNKFAMRTAIEKIVESATGESCSHSSMETLKSKLCHILNAQTFLLVLDNVYIENSNEWLDLMEILAKGSKKGILMVTTREDRVAFIAGTMEAYKLYPLSEDHSWSIFVKWAFREGEEKAYPLLVRIGKDIVRKCCGVPLAAKTLGCQLRTVRDEHAWRSIEGSQLWKIKQESSDILPSLKLSFDQLPDYLRPCFTFCSAFSKGSLLFKDDLINHWMALGLLRTERMNGSLEDIGNKYFKELLSRSFFETVNPSSVVAHLGEHKDNILKAYPKDMLETLLEQEVMHKVSYKTRLVQMHDLVHDLAIYVAGEETTFLNCGTHDVSVRARHLVWVEEKPLPNGVFPRQLQTAKKARSLLFHRRIFSCMSKSFLKSLILNFQCLRILLLPIIDCEDLPNSIGNLKHLMYLSLENSNKLMRLPNSICRLVNLQTLNVMNCVQLELFPRDFHRLVSLRYLVFTSRLANFSGISFHGWNSIQEIMIYNCMQLITLPEQIGYLTTLRILRIMHCPCLSSLPKSLRDLNHLELIGILGCQKMDLMGWEGLHGLRSLQELCLHRLPLLVHFSDGLQSVIGSLRYLSIINCQNLIALPECLQHCTSLLHLTLFRCPSLSALPKGIQALKTLQQLSIADCPKLSQRCEREIGDDWHLISCIPRIQVDHCFIQNNGFPTCEDYQVSCGLSPSSGGQGGRSCNLMEPTNKKIVESML